MKSVAVCWGLRKHHIDAAARVVGINPYRLTEKDYEEIINSFINELKREDGRWKIFLEDAIETVVR